MNSQNSDYLRVMYSDRKRPFSNYPFELANHLIRRFKIASSSSILDVGCGRGDMLQAFSASSLRPTGVDLSDMAAGNISGVQVTTANFEIEPLPFEQESFDVVFSKSVVEHLNRPEKLMQEMHRVAKPGGLVITMCPSWEHQWKIFYSDYTHKTPITRVSLVTLKEVSGLEDINVEYFRQLPILWSQPWLKPLATVTRILVPQKLAARSKWVRFSKEIMLIGVGRKIKS
jgi:SAM-dependent methyltransferase